MLNLTEAPFCIWNIAWHLANAQPAWFSSNLATRHPLAQRLANMVCGFYHFYFDSGYKSIMLPNL